MRSRWLLPPCLLETFPAGCPFEGRYIGGYSCRVSSLLWAGRIFPSSRYITGVELKSYIAIVMPMCLSLCILYFQSRCGFCDSGDFLFMGLLQPNISQKTIDAGLFTSGTSGNNVSHGLPARSAGSAFGSEGRAGPCADRRSVPVERSRALRRRPHNRSPMTRPAGWRLPRPQRASVAGARVLLWSAGCTAGAVESRREKGSRRRRYCPLRRAASG